MAKFNPDVPDVNPPSYLGYSKPISPYEGDTSAGIALKGAGTLLGEATTGADEVIKSIINTGLRTDLTKERDVQTGALEQMAGVPNQFRVSPYQATVSGEAAGSTNDIIPGATAQPLPAQLQNLDQSVASVNTGVNTKPGLGTYYTGRLDMIAKDYRSQFPGYADYIDERVSAITGGNPANERIKDLMTMIQQSQSKDHAETEKALSYVGSNAKYPGAAVVAKTISSGIKDPMAYAINWASKWESIDYKTDQQIKNNTLVKGTNENKLTENEQVASGILADINNQTWSVTQEGMKYSGANLEKVIQDHLTGTKKITDIEGDNYGAAAQALGASVRVQMSERLNRKGDDGKSIADVLGPVKTKQMLDEATDHYTRIGNMFLSKEYGPAFQSQRFVTAKTDEASAWLLGASPIKDYMGFYSAIAKQGGPAAAGIMTQELVGGTYGSLDKTIKEYGKFNTLQMSTTPNKPLETVIDDMNKRGVGTDASKPEQRKAFEYFTNEFPNKIADRALAPAIRTQIAENIFNGNIVGKFQNDSYDDRGKLISGKHVVVNNMTKPEIRDAVWDLSGNGTGPLWLQYKNWTTRQTNELLNGDIHDLNKLSQEPFLPRGSEAPLKFTYDTDTHQVGYLTKEANPWQFDPILGPMSQALPQKLKFINDSLKPIIAIAEKEGQDPNVAVMRQMINMGLDPRGVSMPDQLMKAIVGPETPTDKKDSSSFDIKEFKPEKLIQDAVKSILPQGAIDYLNSKFGENIKQGSNEDTSLELSAKSKRTPVETQANLPASAKALLDTISGSESPDYNTRYGGKKFTDFSKFPSGAAEITEGPNKGKFSSASGRYQFIRGTWEAQAKKLGLKDFSPESQDIAAWDLAQTAYARKYPDRDLIHDIANPNMAGRIASALKSEWTSLPGGIESNSVGRKFAANLQKNLSKHYTYEAGQLPDDGS